MIFNVFNYAYDCEIEREGETTDLERQQRDSGEACAAERQGRESIIQC